MTLRRYSVESTDDLAEARADLVEAIYTRRLMGPLRWASHALTAGLFVTGFLIHGRPF